MKKIIQWGGAVSIAVALVGCAPLGIGGSATAPSPGPPIRITEHMVPSALVAVLNGRTFGPALSGLVIATARPLENLTVLQADTPPRSVVSSAAPAPPTIVVAGRPAAPGKGSTSYLSAQYASRLKHWQGEVAAGRRAEAARTRDTVSAWLRGLGLRARTGGLVDPPGSAGSLPAESADAASALAGLEEEDGNNFGGRRVLVLYSADLIGRPPAGELAGDKVIVVTPFLPTAAAASAAQADLLAAGAAQAAVVGPEVTGSQLATLVSAGLSQGPGHDFVLTPGTVRQRQRRPKPSGRRPAHRAPSPPAPPGRDRDHQRLRIDTGHRQDELHAVVQPGLGRGRLFRGPWYPGRRTDHRGAWGGRPARIGRFGSQSPGDHGHRVALTSGLPPPGQRSGWSGGVVQ